MVWTTASVVFLGLILLSSVSRVHGIPDTCGSAVDLPYAPGSPAVMFYEGDNFGATTEFSNVSCTQVSSLYNDVYYRYTMPLNDTRSNMTLEVSFCGSDITWNLGVELYYGTGCGSLPTNCYFETSSSASCPGLAPTTQFPFFYTLPVSVGQSVVFRIGGRTASDRGRFRLTIANGDVNPRYCDRAWNDRPQPLALYDDSARQSIKGIDFVTYAGAMTSVQPSCGVQTYLFEYWTLFYMFEDTTLFWSACDTANNGAPIAVMDVFDSCGPGAQQLTHNVTCNAVPVQCYFGGFMPQATWFAKANTTYYARLSWPVLPGSASTLYWQQAQVGFANDECLRATALPTDAFGYVSRLERTIGSETGLPTAHYDTPAFTAYTNQSYRKNTGCVSGSDGGSLQLASVWNSLWYSWVAPSGASLVDVSMCGPASSFDSVLEVYSACPDPSNSTSLTWTSRSLACNNDNPLCGGTGKVSAIRGLSVQPGVRYLVRVGSAQSEAYGDFNLQISPSGGGPQCEAAVSLDQALYSGYSLRTLANASSTSFSETCLDSVLGNANSSQADVWTDYYVSESGEYWFGACFVNQTGGHVAIYASNRSSCPSVPGQAALCGLAECGQWLGPISLTAAAHYRVRIGAHAPSARGALLVSRREALFTSFEESLSFEAGVVFQVDRTLVPSVLAGLRLVGVAGTYRASVFLAPKPLAALSGDPQRRTPFTDPSWVAAFSGDVSLSGVAELGAPVDWSAVGCTGCFAWENDTSVTQFSVAVVLNASVLAVGPLPGSGIVSPPNLRFSNPDMSILASAYRASLYTPLSNETWVSQKSKEPLEEEEEQEDDGEEGSIRRRQTSSVQPNLFFSFNASSEVRQPVIYLRYVDPALHPLAVGSTTGGGGGGSSGLSDAEVAAIAASSAVGGTFVLLLLLCLGCCALLLLAIICPVVLLFCGVLVIAVIAVIAVVVLAVGVAAIGTVSGSAGSAVAGLFVFKKKKKQLDVELMNFFDVEDTDDGLDLQSVLQGAGLGAGNRFRVIDWEDLKIRKKLGEGAFGKVYKARWRGADVAVKTINLVNMSDLDPAIVEEFRAEATLMELLGNHPNVVGFVGAVISEDHLALVTEFCPHGSLFDLLYKEHHEFSELELLTMARDCASALSHLHSEGVIHRDIAARNILVAADMTIRVSDFGMSRVVSKADEASSTGTTKSNVGPVKWMAPESITKKVYSRKSDAFMFGVLLWEMFTREDPFGDMGVLDVAVGVSKDGLRLPIPHNAPSVIQEIMRRVWHANPESRPDLSEVETLLAKEVQERVDQAESSSSESDFGHMESAGSIGIPLNSDNSYSIPAGTAAALADSDQDSD